MIPDISEDDAKTYRLSKNRFVIMIGLAIVVAVVLVGVAMALYNLSGAAQVDLSRPGYKTVRDQMIEDGSIGKPFSSTGPINRSTVDSFREKFDKTADQIKSVESFTGDQLSNKSLGIDQ